MLCFSETQESNIYFVYYQGCKPWLTFKYHHILSQNKRTYLHVYIALIRYTFIYVRHNKLPHEWDAHIVRS